MTVTTSGEIVEPSNKIFSQKVMEDKKLHNKNKLLTNEIIKSNKRHLDSQIVAQKPIISVASGWNNLQNLEKGAEESNQMYVDSDCNVEKPMSYSANEFKRAKNVELDTQEADKRYVDLDYISQRPMSHSVNEFKKSQNVELDTQEFLRNSQHSDNNGAITANNNHFSSYISKQNSPRALSNFINSQNNNSSQFNRNVEDNRAAKNVHLQFGNKNTCLNSAEKYSFDADVYQERDEETYMRRNDNNWRQSNNYQGAFNSGNSQTSSTLLSYRQSSNITNHQGLLNKETNGKSFEVYDMQGNGDPRTDSMNFRDTYPPLSTKNYNSTSTYDNEMETQVSADEDSSDSSSDDENECSEEIVKKMAVLFPMKITKKHVEISKLFMGAIEYAFELRTKSKCNLKNNFQIPIEYFQPGDDREEVSPSCGFYLRKEVFNYIKLSALESNKYNSKIIVKKTLIEVYGDSLKNYSATGVRSSRPGIDWRIFKSLYELINKIGDVPVSMKALKALINKNISNKRKHKVGIKKNSLPIRKKQFNKKSNNFQDADKNKKDEQFLSNQQFIPNGLPAAGPLSESFISHDDDLTAKSPKRYMQL
ncbi:probable serine/threonine-protein kinase clkA [Leptopilina heterotoma]|uniref:probable serine/threonine-protein kinase clkA n=1 Tax=Leptopilina heterotoma TaxID=63436 RepID=UPI001CA8B648|nr:probable serine/threonine-protein kinase clkA [Leptopilina heterotoma]